MNTLAIVLSATLLTWPIVAMAQVKVLMSGGFSGAYEQLLPEFERTNGIKVTTGSGASQGSGPQTIGAQLASGVAADLVILSREGLEELIAAKRIAAGTEADLARVGLGVAVRADTPKPHAASQREIDKGFWTAMAAKPRGRNAPVAGLTSEPLRELWF
jgi:molybdate transport system substrate-binding protein